MIKVDGTRIEFKVSASDVSRITFEAIRTGQFYIYSHPQALGGVRERMEAIVEGRNPRAWPGMEGDKVLRVIEMMGERVLPYFHRKYGRG